MSMQTNMGMASSKATSVATRSLDPVREEQRFHRDLVEAFLATSGLVEPHDAAQHQSAA
jgi:hypothetical protein